MITATVRLNLSRDDREADRRAVTLLYAVPDGSRVVVYVGGRRYYCHETAGHLAQYVDTHHLDIEGEPGPVADWTSAVKAAR